MSARSRSGGQRQLAAVATSNTLVFLGQFTVYTFITVLLLRSGVGPAFVGPILLACGASGLLGLWYAGRGLDRNPRRTALLLVALILGGDRDTRCLMACARDGGYRDSDMEWRIRRRAIDISSMCRACSGRAARTGGRMDQLHRQHRNRGRGRYRSRSAPRGRALGIAMAGCGAHRLRPRGNASVSPSIPARALSYHVRFNASSEVDGYSSADPFIAEVPNRGGMPHGARHRHHRRRRHRSAAHLRHRRVQRPCPRAQRIQERVRADRRPVAAPIRPDSQPDRDSQGVHGARAPDPGSPSWRRVARR